MVIMRSLVATCFTAHAAVIDDGFDCRLRHLALDYARDVVLKQWPAAQGEAAEAVVAQGLNIAECGGMPSRMSKTRMETPDLDVDDRDVLFVSPGGNDGAAGTVDDPLRTIAGAQRRIRQRWPNPIGRPALSVRIRAGRYHDGTVSFNASDSGSSPEASIIYAAALDANGEPEPVILTGGFDLNVGLSLSWAQAASPAGALVAKLPPHFTPPDAQDQLFIDGVPMVRARVPNGRPWIPMDGFNLTAGANYTVVNSSMPDIPQTFKSCLAPQASDFPCKEVTAVCKATNSTNWPFGYSWSTAHIGAASARDLGSRIEIDECIEEFLFDRYPKDWGAQSWGFVNKDDLHHKWINKMDEMHNVPYWYGPWAGGLSVNTTQDAGVLDLASLSWRDAGDVVVHAMADAEWGGCQFRVATSPVDRYGEQAVLKFQYGGWQQARTALLYRDPKEKSPYGNRFYMEGSLEFLDSEGEWHFDHESNSLYVFPPAELGVKPETMVEHELLLTQTDRLFEFVGTDDDRVRNLAISNVTLAYTSAQFFKPHEETSGGDYAVHRGAAVFVESAANVTIVGNTFQHIGGNAVFLSNAVGDVRVSSNLFRFIGTSGVSVVGRTGQALGDGRDGEAIVQRHGKTRDNGVRLPRRNVIDHNVFADFGVWDKQSACYHRALTAPDNVFLNNVCFNASRHAVNYEEGMGGGGVVEGNLWFNLNRETSDTSSFNAWGRRTYLLSDHDTDPAVPRLVPKEYNSVRRNLILSRNYYDVGYNKEVDGVRCDDGASWYNFSSNVLYIGKIGWNGGSQVYTHGNLFIKAGWELVHPLAIGGSSFDTFVDPLYTVSAKWGVNATCEAFWAPADNTTGLRPAFWRGDHNLVANSAANTVDWSQLWCGLDLSTWSSKTKQDNFTREFKDQNDWRPDAVVKRARLLMRSDTTSLAPPHLRGILAETLSDERIKHVYV